ncbi:MAG: winged helix-turn-helix domain-containing protein [Candidatus Bathyarchaeia archaeon]
MNPQNPATSSKRRDKLFIIAEILEIAKEGTLKTQVMYRANLSFAQLNDYLDFMLKIGLLEKTETNGKEVYRATEKGLNFLQRYHEINQLLRTNEGLTNGKNNVKVPPPHLLKKI